MLFSKEQKSKILVVGIYIAYLLGFKLPWAYLGGAVVCHLLFYLLDKKASDCAKTHYRFQIRTFWIGLAYSIIYYLLLNIVVLMVSLTFFMIVNLLQWTVVAWIVARCLFGLIYSWKNKEIPLPASWFIGYNFKK